MKRIYKNDITKVFQYLFQSRDRNTDRSAGIVIESEEFPKKLRYIVTNDQIILASTTHGAFAVNIESADALADELKLIAAGYEVIL